MSKSLPIALLEFLDIDPHYVLSFELRCAGNDPPTLTVEYMVVPIQLDDYGNAFTECRRYSLTELDT